MFGIFEVKAYIAAQLLLGVHVVGGCEDVVEEDEGVGLRVEGQVGAAPWKRTWKR